MVEPLLKVTAGNEYQPKMITPGVPIYAVKFTPIPVPAVTDVGVATVWSYNIFRLQLPMLLKLIAVIGTVAVVADVLIVPSVAIGAFWALRFIVIAMISIENMAAMNFMV